MDSEGFFHHGRPEHRIGKFYPVKNSSNGRPLPEGLPAGAIVKVKDFQADHYTVEYQGREFRVFGACVVTD